jgi:hypothetical protein
MPRVLPPRRSRKLAPRPSCRGPHDRCHGERTTGGDRRHGIIVQAEELLPRPAGPVMPTLLSARPRRAARS